MRNSALLTKPSSTSLLTPSPQGLSDLPTYGIQVRHFAGHAMHTLQLEKPIRVAHLTDLHVGMVTPMKVQETAVRITNALNPDIVVITGDFVCHSHAFLEDLTWVLSSFEAPVFTVLGNHDYWSGAAAVRRAILASGAELLSNQNTIVEIDSQRLQIVGLDDAYTGHADQRKALLGLNPLLPTLGLSHIAEEADGLWAGGVPLVLSGHTHAGQLTFAKMNEWTLGKIGGHRYVHGLYGDRSLEQMIQGAVYVGAGIGASVMPLRLGDRGQREITLFDLGTHANERFEHHQEQMPLRPPSQTPLEIQQLLARKKFDLRQNKKKAAYWNRKRRQPK